MRATKAEAKYLYVRLDADKHRALKAACATNGMSVQYVVERLVTLFTDGKLARAVGTSERKVSRAAR